jgi:hypothetical protein
MNERSRFIEVMDGFAELNLRGAPRQREQVERIKIWPKEAS